MEAAGGDYLSRAAAVVLLWTEQIDEVGPAEECGSIAELHARRDLFRRALCAWRPTRKDALPLSAKQVQRSFFNTAPPGGVLPPLWRRPLQGMCMEPVGSDLDLAVRGLFAGGAEPWAVLIRRRPELAPTLARLLGTGRATGSAAVTARQLIANAALPIYVTDPAVSVILDANEPFADFMGLELGALFGMSMERFLELVAAMTVAPEPSEFVEEQDQVIAAGRSLGSAELVLTTDLGRRAWMPEGRRSRSSGRFRLHANAHEVLDARGERACFIIVYHLYPLPDPVRPG